MSKQGMESHTSPSEPSEQQSAELTYRNSDSVMVIENALRSIQVSDANVQQFVRNILYALWKSNEANPFANKALMKIGISKEIEGKRLFVRTMAWASTIEASLRQLASILSSRSNRITLAVVLSTFADSFEEAYATQSSVSCLHLALSTSYLATSLIPYTHPDKPRYLNNLGISFQTRFERFDRAADLENAVIMKQQAVELTPDDSRFKPGRLTNLGNSLETRFSRFDDLADLERAIDAQKKAVDLVPDWYQDKPAILSNLGNSLEVRYARLGDVDDLERAIMAKQRAVHLTPDSHPEKHRRLRNLAISLQSRYERFGHLVDIQDMVTAMQESVARAPDGHLDKAGHLTVLGNSLEAQFSRLGNLADLEGAIAAQRRAVALTLIDHADLPERLNNLGICLLARSERLGNLSDLKDAIISLQQATSLTPDDHPEKPSRLSNFGISLKNLFGRHGRVGDLEAAIAAMRSAVEATPDGHPLKPRYLSNLGASLDDLFKTRGHLDDLESAIMAKRQGLDLTPAEGHTEKPRRLENLGKSLDRRFEALSLRTDLEESISTRHQAIDLSPDRHPNLSEYLSSLGRAYGRRFILSGDVSDFDRASDAFARGADYDFSPPRDRLEAARRSTALYTDNPSLAPLEGLLAAYRTALSLIPQVAWLGHDFTRRYAELSDLGDITSAAVDVAIKTGNLPLAIEWLEEGRSVVWGQLLQLRTPVDELHQQHPQLAMKFQEASRALDAASHMEQLYTINRISPESDVIGMRSRLAENYREALVDIRDLPGFERFLLPKQFSALIPVRRSGPVVIINVYSIRCDALAVFPAEEIVHIPLPKVSSSLLETLRGKLAEHLTSANVRDRASKLAVIRKESGDRREAVMEHVLERLWTLIVRPILQALKQKLPEHRDSAGTGILRVTWCATGPLAFLPLHAAGIYDGPDASSRAYKHIISSYTPSLSALTRASPPPQKLHSILAISQSKTPGYSPLPGTASEIANLKRRAAAATADGLLVTHLDGQAATVDAVLAAIDRRRPQIVHLACHGVQDRTNSTKSAFMLHDGPLSLKALMAARSAADGDSGGGGELAFLSACQTAAGDEKVPEEAVHLAAGMLSAGYRSVIGTMWSIDDDDAPLVADEVYGHLLPCVGGGDDGGCDSALALHRAVDRLRDEVGEKSFLRWIPFVHFGPQ